MLVNQGADVVIFVGHKSEDLLLLWTNFSRTVHYKSVILLRRLRLAETAVDLELASRNVVQCNLLAAHHEAHRSHVAGSS